MCLQSGVDLGCVRCIVEQRALLRERHAQLERLTQSQQPDNATSPSPHTRELLAKERALQKMVEMLARNVSAASASLAADRAKADALAQEAGADGAAEQRAAFEDGEAVGKGEEDEGEVETDAGHRADEAAH